MAGILVVEDDENIRNLLEVALKGFQYEVFSYENAEDALKELDSVKPDLAVFDWMLPGMSGVEAIREIRSNGKYAKLPMILLTAKDKEVDLIQGLDSGADDYMTKPFSVLELAARIRSLLRRSQDNTAKVLEYKGLKMDTEARSVTADGKPVPLTLKEFDLLEYLMKHIGKAVSREELFNAVWGYDYVGETRTLDVHINSLRKKLGDPYASRIESVRGIGYTFGDRNV